MRNIDGRRLSAWRWARVEERRGEEWEQDAWDEDGYNLRGEGFSPGTQVAPENELKSV